MNANNTSFPQDCNEGRKTVSEEKVKTRRINLFLVLL